MKAFLEVKASTLGGQTKHIENESLTVSDYLDKWFEKYPIKKNWSNNSIKIREQAIRLYDKPLLGQYKLHNLTSDMYQAQFIDVLAKKFKAGPVQSIHTVVKTVINVAIKERILLFDPIVDVVLPANTERNEKTF